MAATTEPPGYAPQEANHGPRCRDCAFYEKDGSRCGKHGVEVVHYYHCRDWKRNPGLPIGVV